MAQGFTVKVGALQAGSQDAASLQEFCQAVAEDAVAAIAAMAGAAGHADLASALTDAANRGDKAFTGMLAAYGHASQGLATSAQSYSSTEQANAAAARAVADRDLPFLNGMG